MEQNSKKICLGILSSLANYVLIAFRNAYLYFINKILKQIFKFNVFIIFE